ncbi:hypothetical protein [Sphingobacterium multivorum]|uniref:hypothetical protein n=1 Tax=Sphingobacterium multivorum TaxID=28454 RepID=UPI0028A04E98|nr:hypothetical protein [Sphingobacterium multivorum]
MRNIKDILSFEKMSPENSFALTGGFSKSYQSFTASGDDTNDNDGGTANNCLGGNCHVNCGPFQNDGCNSVVGCGTG